MDAVNQSVRTGGGHFRCHESPKQHIRTAYVSIHHAFHCFTVEASHFVVALAITSLYICSVHVEAQSPFASSRQSLLLSNGHNGVSESWINLLAPSGLTTNYRLILPTTAPSLNQLLSVSSISGNDYTMSWTDASNITGSGTSTQIAYWTGSSTLSSNSNLYWDNTNKRLGVGTNSPSATIHSIVTNSSSNLTSLSNSNRTLLAENTSNNGSVGIQFVARNSSGTARKVNMGIDPTLAGTNTVFGIIPDGISDGGLLIDNVNGNVEIGSTLSGSSIVNKLSVNGNLSVGSGYRENAAPSDGAIIQGNVGIGTSSPSNQLTVYNGSTTGNYTTSGWTHSSDLRLKTDIHPILNALDIVRSLQGVYFRWRNHPREPLQIGFIAQQVEPVLPEVVSTDAQGFKSLAYSNITAVHNEAIKELDVRMSALEKRSERADATDARQRFLAQPTALHQMLLDADQSTELGVYGIPPFGSVKIESLLRMEALSDVVIQVHTEQNSQSSVFLQCIGPNENNAWVDCNAEFVIRSASTEAPRSASHSVRLEGLIVNPYDHPLQMSILLRPKQKQLLLDGSYVQYIPVAPQP